MTSEPRLSIIPGWIVTDPRLKGKDLQVICMLGRNANTRHGWCRRSQVKLAEALSCSRSTVQAAIDRLVEIGALERRKVESASGRDSAHWYRVVYDSAVDSSAFDAWDADDKEEFDPNSSAVAGAPPAGIPAPPAGPESAPPAGSGPAPINASTLTPPAKREERERASEDDEGEENPKALERRFRKWWSSWPTYAIDAEMPTRRAWQDLAPEQRKACEERTPDYLAAAKASGRKFSKAAATYLSERAWERLDDKVVTKGPNVSETYTAYSRPWMVSCLAVLSRSPVPLILDKIEDQIVASNPEKEDMIWRNKRMQSGWPEIHKLYQIVADRKQIRVPERLASLAPYLDKVEVGGPIWEAWKRLFHERSWLFIPEPKQLQFVQFPALPEGIEDPDEAVAAALREFQKKLIEVRDHDHAA